MLEGEFDEEQSFLALKASVDGSESKEDEVNLKLLKKNILYYFLILMFYLPNFCVQSNIFQNFKKSMIYVLQDKVALVQDFETL